MSDEFSQDLEDAIKLLEAFESEPDHTERTRDFEDAIDILNDCMSDKIADHLSTKAVNLKKTYTKKLLVNLSDLLSTEFDIWFLYTRLLLLKVPNEVKLIINEYPTTGKTYSTFINLWRKEAIEIGGGPQRLDSLMGAVS